MIIFDSTPSNFQTRVKRFLFYFGTLLFLFFHSSVAFAYCSEPTAPDAPWDNPPTAPYCFNEWDNTHTCDEWEIESWINEINDYIQEMIVYANEAKEFARNAVDFANCQIEEAKSPLQ